MYTYKIEGQMTYNDADTFDGLITVDIDETISVDVLSAEGALGVFLADNEQYEFYGSVKTCDAETGGYKCATFKDQNEEQVIDVTLLERN